VLFISFFPQLVAGPIERSDRLLPQLAVSPNPTAAQLADGALLIVWGFFKKLVVADNLVTIVGRAFDMPDASSLGTLLGMYAFTWQIYCDFSGYSDIARGFAKWLGVELMVNFNLPFFADSPRDIWRRWHISLSEWLRDYLYIPMGGGRSHAGRNLILTMLLGGLWHGANWTFIAWGAWHGVALALQRRVRWSLPRPLAIVLTFHLLMFGFVLFRAPSIGSFVAMMGRLGEYTFQRGDLPWLRLLVWLTLPVFAAELWTFLGRPVPRPLRAALVVVATVAIVLLGASQGQPFVYFQF
jgi:D-alanyl-lipoteichoic acid acyltransferase DltB (MBOAT superfamily)